MPTKVVVNDENVTVSWSVGDPTKYSIEQLSEICRYNRDKPEYEEVEKLLKLELENLDKKGHKKERVDQATQLVQLAYQDGKAEYFTDTRGDTYGRIWISDRYELLNLSENTFSDWLSYSYYNIEGKVPSGETLRSAINILRGKARFGGSTHELFIRIAEFEGAFWYDLSNPKRQAVRIDKDGWGVIDSPPPLFKFLSHMKPQDLPIDGGPGYLDKFLDLINIQDGMDGGKVVLKDRTLFKIMLIADLVPGISGYGLSLSGPAGAAKSTMLMLEKALIDPSEMLIFQIPKDEKELIRIMDRHHIVPFDNTQDINNDFSNTLCSAITGVAVAVRRLYTDDGDVIRRFKRLVRLNGISNEVIAPDLLDRMLLMELAAIPKDKKREEKAVWAEFYSIRPYVMAEIFEILSKAIGKKECIEPLKNKERLADWYEWAEAIASVLDIHQIEFEKLFKAYTERQNSEAIEQSMIAPIIIDIVNGSPKQAYLATAAELFKRMNEIANERNLNRKIKGWPVDPPRLGKALTPLIPNLKSEGYHVKKCRFEDLKRFCPSFLDYLESNSDRARDDKDRVIAFFKINGKRQLPVGWNSIGNSNLDKINAVTVPSSQQCEKVVGEQ